MLLILSSVTTECSGPSVCCHDHIHCTKCFDGLRDCCALLVCKSLYIMDRRRWPQRRMWDAPGAVVDEVPGIAAAAAARGRVGSDGASAAADELHVLALRCGHPCPPAVCVRLIAQESTNEVCEVCDATVSAFDTVVVATGKPLRQSRPESIWGQTYVWQTLV